MRRFLTIAVLAAAVITASSGAATIQDLQNLGYTVTISNPGNYTACGGPIYYITGYGNSSYFQLCDAAGQALVDAWANPVALCNTKWQFNHPEQLDAFTTIIRKNYTVSGDQCADSYNVSNGYTGQSVYSGAGVGLVALAAQLPAAQPAQNQSAATTPAQSCLPLCVQPVNAPPAPDPTPSTTTVVTPSAPVQQQNAPATTTPDTSFAAVNPAVATAVSRILGTHVTLTHDTLCVVGKKAVGCWKLAGKIKRGSVKLRMAGKTVAKIVVPA